MSSPTTQPQAPGWYPDPSGSHGMRWWDGQDWWDGEDWWDADETSKARNPSTRLTPRPSDQRLVPLGPRFARLGDVLGHLLLLNAGLALTTVAIEAVFPQAILARVMAVIGLALFAFTGLMWCAWQWRLAVSSPYDMPLSPAGHVWSWFVPVVSLWFPAQNLNDLWHAYANADSKSRRLEAPVALPWWLCWTVSGILGLMGLAMLFRGESPPSYFGVAWAMSAVLAWFVVRRLSWRALLYHVDQP